MKKTAKENRKLAKGLNGSFIKRKSEWAKIDETMLNMICNHKNAN